MMQNRHILITGAAGSIGSELVRQLANDNYILCLDNNETELFNLVEELRHEGKNIEGRIGDIRNKETVKNCFSAANRYHFDTVFHAAAYKHVTPMEYNPEEAVETNIIGTINLVKESQNSGIEKFIFISSDKAVNSSSVMGVSKRMCELIVKNAGYVSVRFANVLGSRGSVIPIWQKQFDEGKRLTVTDERMERYFMTVQQAVELVIKAAELGQPRDIIVLDMGKPVKIIDLAKKIIGESGQDIETEIIGIRPGEQLIEKLMSDEEAKVAVKYQKFWIINDVSTRFELLEK